jgi:hypothetical protein
MAILTYEDVNDKASRLRAMTSLDREEFEQLAGGDVWDSVGCTAGASGP